MKTARYTAYVRCRAERCSGFQYPDPMLHEFLSTNRADLISRCRLKVSQRDSPPATTSELENGIPLILTQLAEALMHERASPMRREESIRGDSPNTPAWIESGRTAGLHGAELFKLGYSLAQVVHDYGDLCQAITESAIENHASITVDEFHTFNRLLDNSIANAVASFGMLQHSSSFSGGAQDIHDRLGTLADEQRKLVDTALGALDALKRGNVGLMGATGALLEDSLIRMRGLNDRALPEIRVASGMLTPRTD
jgi:hypothetical protein